MAFALVPCLMYVMVYQLVLLLACQAFSISSVKYFCPPQELAVLSNRSQLTATYRKFGYNSALWTQIKASAHLFVALSILVILFALGIYSFFAALCRAFPYILKGIIIAKSDGFAPICLSGITKEDNKEATTT